MKCTELVTEMVPSFKLSAFFYKKVGKPKEHYIQDKLNEKSFFNAHNPKNVETQRARNQFFLTMFFNDKST